MNFESLMKTADDGEIPMESGQVSTAIEREHCYWNFTIPIHNAQGGLSKQRHVLPFGIRPMQDSLDQCPMPINADQNSGIDPNVDQFLSMPDQAELIRHWSALNWSELIGNDRHWEAFRINAMILIGIDRHWSALGIDRGVLPMVLD